MPDVLAPTNESDRTLGEVRSRRRSLHSAMVAVETAAARPRQPLDRWAEEVADGLKAFARTLEEHTSRNEEVDGLFAQILDEAPRLHPAVNRMREEHAALRTEVRDLLERCGEVVSDESAVDDIRERVLRLFQDTSRHRQAGADLIYEAYEVDIAAAD